MIASRVPRLTFDRAYGALVGHAAGDALGAVTENLDRAEIARRFGWVDDFVADDPASTDDTEFSVLTAWTVLAHGDALTSEAVAAAWRRTLLGQRGGFARGGFSELGALANLRRGLDPPACGNDHHEPFSDGAAMRAAPIGLYCAGDPARAARLAAADARVSHARDGVYCAQAVAAGVAAAVATTRWTDVVAAALAQVPVGSWTHRALTRAAAIGAAATCLPAALDRLHDALVVAHYPWSDVGPEAVGLAFGVFSAARGDYVHAVLGGVNAGRDADTIAAIAGALAGGLRGAAAVPPRWRHAVEVVRGGCVHATAGTRLDGLAKQLVAAARAAAEREGGDHG